MTATTLPAVKCSTLDIFATKLRELNIGPINRFLAACVEDLINTSGNMLTSLNRQYQILSWAKINLFEVVLDLGILNGITEENLAASLEDACENFSEQMEFIASLLAIGLSSERHQVAIMDSLTRLWARMVHYSI